MLYRPKDFIETAEGLLFAVVSEVVEQGKVLSFLRYHYVDHQWQKLDTDLANSLLSSQFPNYLFHSYQLDAMLHAVPEQSVLKHYQPQQALNQLLQQPAQDAVIRDLKSLCNLLHQQGIDLAQFGITGSILIGRHGPASDIDLICYDRATFHQARRAIRSLINHDLCQNLNQQDWLQAYQRRACDFPFADYLWHEQRKYNKAVFNRRKFDLSLWVKPDNRQLQPYKKIGRVHIRAQVIEDCLGFDYPAQWRLAHPDVGSVVSFTATYTGQALAGEWVEIAGQLELEAGGEQRIVVGSSREAPGEFIRVLR